MGVSQIVFLIFMFIISVAIFDINKKRKDYLEVFFNNKDLPIMNNKKVGKHVLANVKLYGLELDEKGKINRENYYYSIVGRIINAKWQFELNDSQGIDVIKPDFRLAENKDDFMDIIATYTNFDLRKFVFNGEDKYKLFNLDVDLINKMKDHAEYIVDEIFKDMCASIEESGIFGDIEIG